MIKRNAVFSALLGFVALAPHAKAAGPLPLNFGIARSFAILSETGVTDVSASRVTGNVGSSPITGAADLLTCSEVTGRVFSVDAAGPAPCSVARAAMLGKAIGAMQTAYADAAARTPDVIELATGNIGGLTLAPGTYKWSSNVLIPASVILKGSSRDVWIFQVAQNVEMASSTAIKLRGGARPANIFWQVAGEVTIGTGAQFEGNILSKTAITMNTGSTIQGRLYSQTAVNLQMATVKRPGG